MTSSISSLLVDPVSGLSGDMWLGALIDLGVPWESFMEAITGLGLTGYQLESHAVSLRGLHATKVTVTLHDDPQPHRHLQDVLAIIDGSSLPCPVKEQASHIFQRLAEAEAHVHGCSVDHVHFHEVGAVDAIIDIVGTCWCLHYLGVKTIYLLPLPLGSGTVRCAHGLMPVPAPATAELVRDFPVIFGHGDGELVTPTGAAIATTLGTPLPSSLPIRPLRIGYGAGSRDGGDRPNVLRLIQFHHSEKKSPPNGQKVLVDHPGQQQQQHRHGHGHEVNHHHRHHSHASDNHDQGHELESGADGELPWETVDVITTSLDDINPQWLPPLMEHLLQAGALDVQCQPSVTKKGRPSFVLTLVSLPRDRNQLLKCLFAESTTFGIRCRSEQRTYLLRDWVDVTTDYGTVRIKRGWLGKQLLQAQPEFEDVLQRAQQHQLPLSTIYQAAKYAFDQAFCLRESSH
ncbi:nickel pincer cofactor biosynthesis protein LarC [Heliophilum fasciatum]|uniref:Pyridinium-3,5-bisthiocarboxylic acid mononucleotide nickel insertion protein n=1 Tax=Heliophilum fasciatum TaxID=35700 RepID=A0A4R2RL91_9FIRM|nr:nickel pincer cofactor biosynthesis protein LarC [Heliophilum fasciatum]MCW2278269.1 uncharacterized protein (TIGR00299 family) protein [Heliophilum fasciatum]TCP63893.1 hypothetical protein EDD73_11441 [Heliophilum fasciatum]